MDLAEGKKGNQSILVQPIGTQAFSRGQCKPREEVVGRASLNSD